MNSPQPRPRLVRTKCALGIQTSDVVAPVVAGDGRDRTACGRRRGRVHRRHHQDACRRRDDRRHRSGSGDCFRIYNKSTYGSRTKFGGGFVGITIDGSGAAAGAAGLHVGDLLQYEVDLTVQNFKGAGSIGVHFDNNYYWTEQLFGRIYAQNCASHVVFDWTSGTATTSSGSFERCDLDLYINQQNAAFDGVVFRNGAFVTNGSLKIRGNFGASAVTSAALRLTGSQTANTYTCDSGITASMLDIGVECATKAGDHVPQTIVFGGSSNTISDCYGALNFGAAGITFAASNNSNNITSFMGRSSGDNTLPGQTNWVTYTGTALPAGITGNVSFRFLPTGNEVMVSWGLAIASGTKLASGATIVTAASVYSAGGNKLLPANATGGGLSGNVYAPAEMAPGGAFKYLGPSYTSTGGSSWWFGQGVFTRSVG
jgi:hypothetical protein